MEIGSILLLLAMFFLVVAYVARPLIERRSTEVTVREQKISTLMAERENVLAALQELDFDNQMGKIPEEDYPVQRARLMERGADVLQKLDTFEIKAPQFAPEEPLPINGHRHLKAPDDDLEKLIADRRRGRPEKSAGFCPQCGHAAQASDKFCSKCGAAL